MMTQTQERALRKLFQQGGKLSLPSSFGPIIIEVTIREVPNYPNRADAIATYADGTDLKFTNWSPRELCAELAEHTAVGELIIEEDAA